MATITSKCPHCGAQITYDEKSKTIVCQYCSSVIAVQKNTNSIDVSNVLHRIFPLHEFIAAYYDTPESKQQTVYLWISDDGLFFKPMKILNLFGDTTDKFISFADICSYQKYDENTYGNDFGFIISIKENDKMIERRVEIYGLRRDRDNILNNIEYYRKQYFIKNGQCTPDLEDGSYIPLGNQLIDMRFSANKIMTYLYKILLLR